MIVLPFGPHLIPGHKSRLVIAQAEAHVMLAAALAQLGAGAGQVEAAGGDGAQSPPGLCQAPGLGALALDCQLQGTAGRCPVGVHVLPPLLRFQTSGTCLEAENIG